MSDNIDKRVWQFKKVYYEVDADEFVSADPFIPQDLSITISNGKAVFDGAYGVDVFSNHRFKLLVNEELIVYTKVKDIPEKFDNLIEYFPDDTHDKTFRYTFKKDGKEFVYTHWVHHDMDVWLEFLPELMKREQKRGSYFASRNKNR